MNGYATQHIIQSPFMESNQIMATTQEDLLKNVILKDTNLEEASSDHQSLKSPISSVQKDETKECKLCGYFGCEGECNKKMLFGDVSSPEKGPSEVEDNGQEFETNDLGLFNQEKTEILIKKRCTLAPKLAQSVLNSNNNTLEQKSNCKSNP